MTGISLDRLAEATDVEAVWLEDATIGAGPVREPHRHDGAPVPVRAGTVTVIGRGAVHVFEHAEGLTGAVLRFGDEVLLAGRVAPGWLLAGRGGRTVPVPGGEADRLERTTRMRSPSRRPRSRGRSAT